MRFAIALVLLSGCAWSSSIDDLKGSFQAEIATLHGQLDNFGAANAESQRQFQEAIVNVAADVRSELVSMVGSTETRILGTVNGRIDGLVTAEQATALAEQARSDALVAQSAQIDALQQAIAVAEKERLAAEAQARKDAHAAAEIASARAELEAERIKQEDAARTQTLIETVATSVATVAAGETAGRLVSEGLAVFKGEAVEISQQTTEDTVRALGLDDKLSPEQLLAISTGITALLGGIGWQVRNRTRERQVPEIVRRAAAPPA